MMQTNPGRLGARTALILATAVLAAPLTLAQDDGDSSPVREAVLDEFHPDKGDGAKPLYGGRVIVHLESLPKHTNYATENSAKTRNFLYEVHEMLVRQDWWTTDYVPSAAEQFYIEDLVVLNADAAPVEGEIEAEVVRRDGGEGRRAVRAVYGEVDGQTVTPISPGNSLAGPVTLPVGAIERVERGSAFTFKIREGVRWHPSLIYKGEAAKKIAGQTLDAEDVRFSWLIYQNSEVNCDEKRFQYTKFPRCQVVDELTVRFFCEKQDAFAFAQISSMMTLLPSHIYDLLDKDCPDYDEFASPSKQATHINDNEHNKLWVGVGPYQIVKWSQEGVEARRFVDEKGNPAYFDLSRAGHVDTIRWRYIQDDEQAMVALQNGELDYFGRVKSEDYFNGRATTEEFKEEYFAGYFYTGYYGFTCWNMYKPALADIAVRKAIAHAFDAQTYLKNQYNGLGYQVTGPIPYISKFYNHDVQPLEYDPDLAIEILEDAGWYDRDGDDIADKDGVSLEIEFLYPGGNDASKILGRALQDAVKDLGIKVNLETMEWATFLERLKKREFDGCNLAWIPELESDPEQLWHSKWGEYDRQSSNNAGVKDPEVDRLIVAIQQEVDEEARGKLWKEFHAKIYSMQPYLFGFNVPRKYAASLKVRGIKHTPISPGYVLREWYFVDPEVTGTRAALMPGAGAK